MIVLVVDPAVLEPIARLMCLSRICPLDHFLSLAELDAIDRVLANPHGTRPSEPVDFLSDKLL